MSTTDRPTATATEPALDAVGRTVSAGRRLRSRLYGATTLYLVAVIFGMAVVFSVIRPDAFPTLINARNVLTDVSILLVMAVGTTYVMVAAGFDLSIGSVLVFAGVVSAKVMAATGSDGSPAVVLGLVVALLSGVLWGVFNGIAITVLKVPALITTLGSMGAALGIARLITDGNDIRTVPMSMISFSIDEFLGLPWIVWIAGVVALVGGVLLHVTRFGRRTYVIGSNDEAARRGGVNVNAHLIKLYALSGLCAGFAGFLSLVRFSTTTMSGHSTDALQVITGVVLGGTSLFGGIGTVAGTVVGMFVSAVLNNGLIVIDVEPFWQEVAIGFILIAAVYIDQRRRRRRSRD